MLNNILKLTKDLTTIKSLSTNKEDLEKALSLAISNLSEYSVKAFDYKGSKSALVFNSKKIPSKFKMLLNGHLDVIPGKENQYHPIIKGNRLYSAGAMDMKASIACMVLVFKEVATRVKYPLGLQLVTDEETGGFNGTKHQIEKGVRADFVISGESTSLNIANKAKGILWIKILAAGKSAHGAYPWKGVNAIAKMSQFLNLLNKVYPTPEKEAWTTTINVSKIETTNNVFNKIPNDCTLWLDIRYIPEDSEFILKTIRKMLPKGFKLEVIVNEPALYTNENNLYVKKLQELTKKVTNKKPILYGANGSSDARHFMQVGSDGIEFGPIGGGIGTDEEWVNIPSLENYYKILKQFLLTIS